MIQRCKCFPIQSPALPAVRHLHSYITRAPSLIHLTTPGLHTPAHLHTNLPLSSSKHPNSCPGNAATSQITSHGGRVATLHSISQATVRLTIPPGNLSRHIVMLIRSV